MSLKKIFILGFLIITFSSTGIAQSGTPDPAYGTNGFSIFQIGNGSNAPDVGHDIVALADGSSLICGVTRIDGVFQGLLIHVLANGTRDLTFGTGGMTLLNYGLETYAYNISLQTDGKIVVSGLCYPVSLTNSEVFVSRFSSSGLPDLSFGTNGKFISAYSSNYEEYCNDQLIQPNGKILVAGSSSAGGNGADTFFMRLNADGTIDNTFGSNGYTQMSAFVEGDEIREIALLSTGEIIACGYYANSIIHRSFLMKLTTGGTVISSFGNNGIQIPAPLDTEGEARGIAVSNDNVFISGQLDQGGFNIYLCKTDANGVAVTSFGNNGITVTDITTGGSALETGWDPAVQPDGKIVVCGTTGINGFGNRDFLMMRYTPAGQLDPTFGITAPGYTLSNLGTLWDEAYGIDFLPDGKIVATGMSNQNDNNGLVAARYLNDGFAPNAGFSASPTYICAGSTVQYTNTTAGPNVSYSWTFEGGTPATSTLENPVVTYVNAGVFDVQLVATNPLGSDTELKNDYITVIGAAPVAPAIPSGSTSVCAMQQVTYSIPPVNNAISYLWQIDPVQAGTLAPNGTSCQFSASSNWTGAYTLKVLATGICGNGPWSPVLACNLNPLPEIFMLEGPGEYCEGSSGATLTLSGSETGTSYELYLDNIATGNIKQGTGAPLAWNTLTSQGFYTARASTASCSEEMAGQVYVSMITVPSQPAKPSGNSTVCSNTQTSYSTTSVPGASSYQWTLQPGNAGTLTTAGNQVTVAWSPSFVGLANLSVQAMNACGNSPSSLPLAVTVNPSPAPTATGQTNVCSGWESVYSCLNNGGSSYSWIVTGGTLMSGAGTSSIVVLWPAAGTGTVQVSETNSSGCTSVSPTLNIQVNPCTQVEKPGNPGVYVYPNPFTDYLNIGLAEPAGNDIKTELMDMHGRILKSAIINKGSSTYSMSNLAALATGVYVIRLTIGGAEKGLIRILKK